METEAETVVDVLRALDQPACDDLLLVADGYDPDRLEMDYEDWVRPLKLTGGRVCLRLHRRPIASDDYVSRAPDGLRVVSEEGATLSGKPAVAYVHGCLSNGAVEAEPVLREDTPFGEEE